MDALAESGVFHTNISSKGGFLRDGNCTMLIGVEDERVKETLDILRTNSRAREQYVSAPSMEVVPGSSMLEAPVKVTVGGAVTFVLDVESFERW